MLSVSERKGGWSVVVLERKYCMLFCAFADAKLFVCFDLSLSVERRETASRVFL